MAADVRCQDAASFPLTMVQQMSIELPSQDRVEPVSRHTGPRHIRHKSTISLARRGRLRIAQGMEGLEPEYLQRVVGIVLALCNGKRTVADIGRITKPFAEPSPGCDLPRSLRER